MGAALPLAGPGAVTMRWLVGTYAEAIGDIALDPQAGRLHMVRTHPCPPNPSFLALHPRLPIVHAVHELRNWQGGVGGAAASYALAADGTLKLLGAQASGGSDPCHLATDAAGAWLVVANYSSGHVTSLQIGPDGALGPAAAIRAHEGASLHPVRQTHPHPHHVAWRDGRLLISDLGLDRLVGYRLDPAGRFIPAGPDVPTPPGGGPRRIVFHPTLPCGWVLNELQATLTRIVFATDGSATVAETVPMLPAGDDGRISGAEVQVAPSGRFVYASNRGHDSIARFAVDAATGRLAPLGHTPSGGAEPRHFAISPCGHWLLAANQNSGTVVLFAIDPVTGALAPTGQSVAMPKPVCLLHIPKDLAP
jgi:6-phosphogluconolactonase